MDHRNDLTEDTQTTPEHPGPNSEAPQAQPPRQTSQPTQSDQQSKLSLSSRLTSLGKEFTRRPLPWLISAAGVVLLLARRKARRS